MKFIKLRTGIEMPIIGLGTFKIKGRELLQQTLEAALQAGYRSIDTAAVYRNETDIGDCLKQLLPKYGLTREDVFITSKLGPKDQGKGKCRQACLQSLDNLQTGYLDLYLIHWPGTQGRKPEDPSNIQTRMESWKDMEQLHKEGKLRAIGVSNYEQHHLDSLLSQCDIPPAVLQIEHHPHLVQTTLMEYCRRHDIHLQAYSSLGTSTDQNKLLEDPTVNQIAHAHTRCPAQVLLRWAVQRNIGVIPKSTNPDHIKLNMDIFSWILSDEDMAKMDALDSKHHYCWNPGTVS